MRGVAYVNQLYGPGPRAADPAAARRRAVREYHDDGHAAGRGGVGCAGGWARRQRRRRAVQLRVDGACVAGSAIDPVRAGDAHERRRDAPRISCGTTAIRRFRGICGMSWSPSTELRICGGATDSEVIVALLNVADSRFQEELLAKAKAAGKVARDYRIPLGYRSNTPRAAGRGALRGIERAVSSVSIRSGRISRPRDRAGAGLEGACKRAR